jgi:hypothetical protein
LRGGRWVAALVLVTGSRWASLEGREAGIRPKKGAGPLDWDELVQTSPEVERAAGAAGSRCRVVSPGGYSYGRKSRVVGVSGMSR